MAAAKGDFGRLHVMLDLAAPTRLSFMVPRNGQDTHPRFFSVTTTLLAGILVAFLATTLAAAWRRAPTRTRCPACGKPTNAVRPPFWMRQVAPGLMLRWCPACSWEGVGRRPSRHRAEFAWGRERVPADFGFRFACGLPDAQPTVAEPPSHPSGFRFAATPVPARPAHPSGFTWNRREGAPPRERVVFRFAKPASPGDFTWGSRL